MDKFNEGYLTSKRDKDSDEQYTPIYAVIPLVKYIPKEYKIWLPFDKEWSAFNQVLTDSEFDTIYTNIDDGYDFFEYEPDEYDMIISTPPFSMKDKVIKRVYELGKPFCLLLPLASLQGKERFKYFKNGIQLLAFDKRIAFHNINSTDKTIKGTPFSCAYFIGGVDILPRDLLIEELDIFECDLMDKYKRKGELL